MGRICVLRDATPIIWCCSISSRQRGIGALQHVVQRVVGLAVFVGIYKKSNSDLDTPSSFGDAILWSANIPNSWWCKALHRRANSLSRGSRVRNYKDGIRRGGLLRYSCCRWRRAATHEFGVPNWIPKRHPRSWGVRPEEWSGSSSKQMKGD